MDQPDHLLASRRHAGKAVSSGGNDPAVQGRLAQTEALLADAPLAAACQADHGMPTLADTFGRQPSAIRSRLNHLGTAHAPQPGGSTTMAGVCPES